MFINKINGSLNNKAFKGYEHIKNDHGKTIPCFYYPYDTTCRAAHIEFFKVKEDINAYGGYAIDENFEPIKIKLDNNADGNAIDVEEKLGLKKGEPYAYRIHIEYENPVADTGMQFTQHAMHGEKKGKGINETYTLVSRAGTTPMSKGGLGHLTMIDTHRPGAQYADFHSNKTGTVVYNKNLQKEKEQIKRNPANKVGGTMAGIEYDIPNLREKGVTTLYLTPFAGADSVFYHGYHCTNLFQMADNIGDDENFDSFAITAFKNGMSYVFDAALTSEGAEGINVQYALKWAEQNPDALYRHRMYGIEDGPIKFAFIPENDENLRHKLINSPYELVKQENGKFKVIENKEYDRKKPTFLQVYDAAMVTEEQANSKEVIKDYEKPVKNSKDKLAVNTYMDVVAPQKMEIKDLKGYKITLENAADFMNSTKKDVAVNSPEVTALIAKTPSFEFTKKNNNIFLWQNKTGLCLRNHGISSNDEKVLMSIPSEADREAKQARIKRGGYQTCDLDIQIVKYWLHKDKDAVTLNLAKTLKGAKTSKEIEKLVKAGEIPEVATLSEQALKNIEDGMYQLEPKGEMERDDVTVKALMKLQLPSLKFADETVSVLAQPFFSNMAPNKELQGKTRFELEKMYNPHLGETERDVYLSTNKLFTRDIKYFADAIIEAMNAKSEEKLLTEDGEYTEYGEYVIEHIGQNIAKYAFMKSLIGNDFLKNHVKAMPETGEIKYNYSAIKEATTLKALGVSENDMVENASDLQRCIQKGMDKLNMDDVKFLADAYLKQLNGTTALDFRISEAMYAKASLGPSFRIDAAKNIKDDDAVKQLSNLFDEFWDETIEYYHDLIEAIAEVNEGSIITGEITDMKEMTQASWGKSDMDKYDELRDAGSKYKDVENAMRHFWLKTGMTTEAGYSNFFTSVITTFSKDYEQGGKPDDGINHVINNLNNLIKTRGVDNIRYMFNFVGNHDKPRVVHFSALNMDLFHNNFSLAGGNIHHNQFAREEAMKILVGVDNISELPLEIKLNINNTDYFRTVSSKAIAMGELLNRGIAEAVSKEYISEDNKVYFRQALANLVEGKYLEYGKKAERVTIDIPEIQNIETVVDEILKNAKNNYGLNLDDTKIESWKRSIKEHATNDRLSDFSVQAGRNDITSSNINWIFETKDDKDTAKRRDDSAYSAYITNLLAFTKRALIDTCNPDTEAMKAFTSSAIDFLNKYDRDFIESKTKPFPYSETPENAERKNTFGELEFEDVLEMLIEEVEFLMAEKNPTKADTRLEKSDEIIKTIYETMHRPAMEKSIAMAALLTALPGIAAIFEGDQFGMTGGEEKSNNIYNKNRNAVMIEALKDSLNKDYIEKMKGLFEEARMAKTVTGAEALNIGTPYEMYVKKDREHLVDRVRSWLIQSKDSMVISIAHDKNVRSASLEHQREHYQELDKDQVIEIPYIEFPEGILIPKDTEFEGILNGEKIKAIVEHFKYDEKGKYLARLIAKNGTLKLDKSSAPNATLILKRVAQKKAKNIAFLGNKQYNISNPAYQNFDSTEIKSGQTLSIIAK